MEWNSHYELVGKHALLSPSKYHWTNYDEEKLYSFYKNSSAASYGTRLHAFAKEAIELGITMKRNKQTLNQFINDAIGLHLSPEVVLKYSNNIFGTCDAIGLNRKDKVLYVHDLKTGTTPASFEQLYIYAALFYLEYHEDPKKIRTVLRIYQSDDVQMEVADNDYLLQLMDLIKRFDILIDQWEGEEFR